MTLHGIAAMIAAASLLPTVQNSSVAQRDADGAILAAAAPGLSPATQFQAGSISKWACSVAVLRFVDRERFLLDDRVVDVLPGFSGPEEVRVRDLLANRSGLADGLMPALRSDGPAAVLARDYDALDAANAFAAGEAASPRDTAFSYDLVNWILVQAILEYQSGEPISAVMESELLGPDEADLPDTLFASGVPALEDAPEVAGEAMPLPSWLACAGGMVTTPSDLLKLMDWVAHHSLSADSLDALTHVTSPEEHYALGGRVRRDEETGALYFWLSGSNGPFKSRAGYRIDTREGFAAMNAADDWEVLVAAKEAWFETVRAHSPSDGGTRPTISTPQPTTPRRD